MKNWHKLFLKYFDFNNNHQVDWWEYTLPILIFFFIEVIANVIANLITGC